MNPEGSSRRPEGSSRRPEEEKGPRAFSWFPGHMRKALRRLEQDLSLADAVLLVMDARIPASSRQPDLEAMLRRKHKEALLVLNKADLAEEDATREWVQALRREGHHVATLSALGGRGPGPLARPLERLRDRVHGGRRDKGLLPRDPRLVVAGIPNVGKSSLLNRLAGAGRARTGARPGVTRGPQWVAVQGRWQLLDSPGILYPRIEGEETLVSLTAAGCVSLDAVPLERVGGLLLGRLLARGHALVEGSPEDDPLELLERLARTRGYLAGREPDLARAGRWLLHAFARGELGKITLEAAA